MFKNFFKRKLKNIKTEINNIELSERNEYLFCYCSVLFGIETLIIRDLKKHIPETAPFFKYVRSELDDCKELRETYPYDNLFCSLESCINQTEKLYAELSDYFFNVFPYKKLIDKKRIQADGNVKIKEFFKYVIYGARNLEFALLDNYQYVIDDTQFDDYRHSNDDTQYTEDYENTEKFRDYINQFKYSVKRYESECEGWFSKVLSSCLSREYHLFPQICLSSIIDKTYKNGNPPKDCNELYRIIDFGIFDDNYNVKMLIEVNDKSHDTLTRKCRDMHVQMILEKAGIKLVTFKPADRFNKDYIIEQLGELLKPELKK